MKVLAKLMAMNAAAQLTAAVVGNLPDDFKADLNIDERTRAANSYTWEVFRIFYHAIIRAVDNDDPVQGWPAPKLDANALLPGGAGGLGNLLSTVIGSVPPDVLQSLVGKIPTEALNALVGKIPALAPAVPPVAPILK